jgi:hypothetical protein
MNDSVFIIGDSFCYDRKKDWHWPLRLSANLSMKNLGTGFRGFSWWKVRDEFFKFFSHKEMENCSIIIFCHTEKDRIWHKEKPYRAGIFDIDPVTMKSIEIPILKEEITAVELYYKYIYDSEFHSWTKKKWYEELVTIFSDKKFQNKKIIHLNCFSDGIDMSILANENSVVFELPLNNYNRIQIPGDNHMTKEENENLADKLTAVINLWEFHKGTVVK